MEPIKPPDDEYSMWDDLKFGLGFPLLVIAFIASIVFTILSLFI